MTGFKIDDGLYAVCESQSTRSGFRHVAKLLRDGYEIGEAKCTYQNRTWERYQFESVLQKLAEKAKDRLLTSEYDLFRERISKRFRD